jgi:hypothetical protein
VRNAIVALKRVSGDDAVVLTDGHNLSASIYGVLQNLMPRRPTMIRTDPYIVQPRSRLKIEYLRASLRPVDRLVVWAPGIVDRYSRALGIPRAKMVVQRFHHTVTGYDLTGCEPGDFIFSGGDSMRDYPTLFRAVRGLDVRVFVATRLQSLGAELPDNVTVKAVSDAEFRQLMVAARLVVIPLAMHRLRTSGQQSYLNAMALGKPVIVTDTLDAPYYIEHDHTGLVVPSGDHFALREALVEALARPSALRAMGEAARAAALPLDQEYTWSNVLKLAVECREARSDP